MTYRNACAHRLFDRRIGLEALGAFGITLRLDHAIPERRGPGLEEELDSNLAEQRLAGMLLRAGFDGFQAQQRIDLPMPYGHTVPDFFFVDPYGRSNGICLYLDGLSRRNHGHPATAERDRQVRDWLRNDGYEVRSISARELDDRQAMSGHFHWLASSWPSPAAPGRCPPRPSGGIPSRMATPHRLDVPDALAYHRRPAGRRPLSAFHTGG